MTWQDALETVVARTRHERFRWLCSDENPDAASREGYRRTVLRLAGEFVAEPPPEPPPLAHVRDSIRGVKLGFRSCFYSSHEGCGCTGTHCYHLRRVVTLRDCLDCLPPIKETA